MMPLKAASVTADVLFPVIVAICIPEVVSLAWLNVVRQKPLGRHHRLWLILLPHGEVFFQLDLDTLVPAVVCQQYK